ncbi:MAG TPA: hypothetical protein VK421_09120 [Pyrinomonadaceae bacterium]|nr:hypothetical protein [Pyrinomonadaceae bacterium]
MLRRLTALGIVAWLAGAGCLLGCSAATASAHAHSQTHAAQDESHTAERPADSCAAMSGHDCCAGVEDSEGGASAGAENHGSRTAMHCPLGGRHSSDPARKVRVQTTSTASAPAAQLHAPASVYASPPRAAGDLVRDRGGTHLRCCVFLI